MNETQSAGPDRYYLRDGDIWSHRTPLKLLVNPVLRRIQFFTERPYVIASKTEFKGGVPRFLGYSLRRVACKLKPGEDDV